MLSADRQMRMEPNHTTCQNEGILECRLYGGYLSPRTTPRLPAYCMAHTFLPSTMLCRFGAFLALKHQLRPLNCRRGWKHHRTGEINPQNHPHGRSMSSQTSSHPKRNAQGCGFPIEYHIVITKQAESYQSPAKKLRGVCGGDASSALSKLEGARSPPTPSP